MRRFCFALAWVLLLPLSFLPQSSEAFVFRKIVYSSPVEGLIHWDGKPLEGVVVTRSLRSGGFKNGEYEDNTTTDAKGGFKLPVVDATVATIRWVFGLLLQSVSTMAKMALDVLGR